MELFKQKLPLCVSKVQIGQAILQSAHMCVIPWVTWTPDNHLYVTHETFQRIVRAALLMLGRKGICGDLALHIVAKVAHGLTERQAILPAYAWDDLFLAYNSQVHHSK